MIVNILVGIGVAFFGFVLQTSIAGVNRKIVGRLQKDMDLDGTKNLLIF